MTSTPAYDYIIAGTGCAGLSLAMHLQASDAGFKKILLIDKEPKNKNDRTWCFWTKKRDNWFDPILFTRWDHFVFRSNTFEKTYDLNPYRFCMIRGLDFYAYCLSRLKNDARFEFITESIESIGTEYNMGVLKAGGKTYTAHYIFNSVFRTQHIKENHVNFIQHFRGWGVETQEDVFDDSCPVLMDFRTEQHNDCRFIYLLPLAKNRALVEYTGFSDRRPASGVYEEALRKYMHEHIGVKEFEITEWEDGEIPMAQSAFINIYGPHVINIGTAGGASKPGSGYTFYFIQRQCEDIIRQIKHKKKLVQAPARKKRFAFYDKTLLHVLNRKNIPAASIFTGLFQKNEISKVLAFLNEETSLMEELKILHTFPNKEFTAAARASYKKK